MFFFKKKDKKEEVKEEVVETPQEEVTVDNDSKSEAQEEGVEGGGIQFVVGVTSCATGIAHTYMAADAIKRACKKRGIKCRVETQGAIGIENKLKASEIAAADLIVFANDVQVKEVGRFDAVQDRIYHTKPGTVIGNPDIIFSGIDE